MEGRDWAQVNLRKEGTTRVLLSGKEAQAAASGLGPAPHEAFHSLPSYPGVPLNVWVLASSPCRNLTQSLSLES